MFAEAVRRAAKKGQVVMIATFPNVCPVPSKLQIKPS
jgi:hypothetical protein